MQELISTPDSATILYSGKPYMAFSLNQKRSFVNSHALLPYRAVRSSRLDHSARRHTNASAPRE